MFFVGKADAAVERPVKSPLLSIVVPTYNERENIAPLLEALKFSVRGFNYKVVFVDDSSPDGTAEVIRALKNSYPVELVVRPKKLGLGSAVLEGISRTDSPYIIVMDADLQHDPKLVDIMVEKLIAGCDIVVASRKIRGGAMVGWSPARRLVSEVATRLAHVLVPKSRKVRDPLSGFFGFRREIVLGVRFEPKGFKLLLEVLVKANYDRVCEVPLVFQCRKSGKSKLNLKEYLLFVQLLLELARYRRNSYKKGGLGGI